MSDSKGAVASKPIANAIAPKITRAVMPTVVVVDSGQPSYFPKYYKTMKRIRGEIYYQNPKNTAEWLVEVTLSDEDAKKFSDSKTYPDIENLRVMNDSELAIYDKQYPGVVRDL
jgi:hypothetical protein